MKKCIKSMLSVMLIVVMVFSLTGLAFASEAGLKKDLDSKPDTVQKMQISGRHETREPERDHGFDKTKEKLGSLITGDSKSGKLSRNGDAAYVARIGNTGYTTLQAAVDEAGYGDTVTVLSDLNEQSISINPENGNSIIIDFDGYGIESSNAEDVIAVVSGNVTILDAFVINNKTATEEEEICTAVYAEEANLTLKNCYVSACADDAVGYYAGDDADVVMNGCEFIDAGYIDELNVSPENITGCIADDYAVLTMNGCSVEVVDGEGVISWGKTNINDSYIAVQSDDCDGIAVYDDGKANINDGYYFAHTALYIGDINSSATIKKGEFVSKYKDYSAIDDFDYEGFGSNVTIASGSMVSPSNWRTYGSDKIDVYTKYSAPKTFKAKLSKYNGISLSWSNVSGAKAYRIYYKKSSAKSWSLLSTTNKTSVNKAGLSSGVKYDFKVHPCDVLDRTVQTRYCNSSNYKTASVYTLKKLSTPKVSKKTAASVAVSWTGIKGVAGYQISKSKSKSGTSIVSTYKTTSGKSKVIKVSKGKTYYYKVRAYALDSKGNKVYAPWSAVKSYKLK